MKRKTIYFLILTLLLLNTAFSEELPKPAYDNVLVISIEHSIFDNTEVDYILNKNNFNFGLYAWLSFSRTKYNPNLDWHSNWNDASNGITGFKDTINSLISRAKDKGLRLHIVVCSGLARWPTPNSIYKDAYEEDVRNIQWYQDNNIAEDDQIIDPQVFGKYVFGTFSRYARKLRANLEAKAKATVAFLKQKMDENPNTLIAVSAWGELEMNFNRLKDGWMVEGWCDYSPFAVLEFRDWIRHTGMYDTGGEYEGEGWLQGGAKYRGEVDGLDQFNSDMWTNFLTWELLYYNWALSDDPDDQNSVDDINQDPHILPYESRYSHGSMIPTLGADYIAGGFDPPRDMNFGDDFWDLWNLFRETMVLNLNKDLAKWANEAEISAERWYSHQIPGDYLWGNNPDNPHPRYYTSASPLWTADIAPYGSLGATIYDVKFGADNTYGLPEFTRTTEFILDAITGFSSNWAVLEYDAETYPVGLNVEQSSAAFILNEYKRVYSYTPHLINFWRWMDPAEADSHTIKGFNKEEALKQFVDFVRGKPRINRNTMYAPPQVIDFSVTNLSNTSIQNNSIQATTSVLLEVSGKIWSTLLWEWEEWSDFKHFEIYRDETAGFSADANSLLATTTSYSYTDTSLASGKAYYYKIRAINNNDIAGPLSNEIKPPGYILTITTGAGGTTTDAPGIYSYLPGTNINISALPETNFRFSSWDGNVEDDARCGPQISVVMDRDRTVTAQFCSKCGDVNGDNNITPGDALDAFNIYLGKMANPTFCQLENADVNASGTRDIPQVTPGDALAIFEKYLGKSDLPSDCSCASRSADQAALTSHSQRNSLFIAPLDRTSVEEIVVPVLVSQVSNIKSFGFDFHYPAQALEFLFVERGTLTQDFTQVEGVVRTAGTIRVGGYSGFSDIAGSSGELVRLVFRLKGKSIEREAFDFSDTVDDLRNSRNITDAPAQYPSRSIIKK